MKIWIEILFVASVYCNATQICAEAYSTVSNTFIVDGGMIIVDRIVTEDFNTIGLIMEKSKTSNSSTNFDNVLGFAKEIQKFYRSPEKTRRKKRMTGTLKGWECWISENGIMIYAKSIDLKVNISVSDSKDLAKLILTSKVESKSEPDPENR